MAQEIKSNISTYTADDVFIRDASLINDLIGKVSFTELTFFQILGRRPSLGELAVVDAVLVTLMEHGFTPSAIISRLTAMSSPEALQASVAAGLLSVGSAFVGTTEDAARLLAGIVASPAGIDAAARAAAEAYRKEKRPLPGFGHHLHKPDDPRSLRLFQVAQDASVPNRHVEALKVFSLHVDDIYGRHITINATGAIAAVLSDIGVPIEIMRGFSILSRCAGLIGHIYEEQQMPTGRAMWDQALNSVTYTGEKGQNVSPHPEKDSASSKVGE